MRRVPVATRCKMHYIDIRQCFVRCQNSTASASPGKLGCPTKEGRLDRITTLIVMAVCRKSSRPQILVQCCAASGRCFVTVLMVGKAMKLSEHDHVLCAYAEPCHGSGWANAPVWFVVQSKLDGKLRHECLQPNEQSAEILNLYRVSAAVHVDMTLSVRRLLAKKKKTKS